MYDGWITPEGKFLREEFSHKETLTKHGYPWDSSDQAIDHGFTRLVDEGGTVKADVKFSHFEVAKRWLLNNVHDREIEVFVFSVSPLPRVVRLDGKL